MGSRLNLESLEVWTTKKLRGFKRANPAVMGNASVRTNLPVNGARNQKQISPPSPSPPASLVPSPATSPDTPTAPQAEISQPEKENIVTILLTWEGAIMKKGRVNNASSYTKKLHCVEWV